MKHANPPKKSFLDALAFANVGNFSEFQALLNASDARPRTTAPMPERRSAIVTPIRRVSSAL